MFHTSSGTKLLVISGFLSFFFFFYEMRRKDSLIFKDPVNSEKKSTIQHLMILFNLVSICQESSMGTVLSEKERKGKIYSLCLTKLLV